MPKHLLPHRQSRICEQFGCDCVFTNSVAERITVAAAWNAREVTDELITVVDTKAQHQRSS